MNQRTKRRRLSNRGLLAAVAVSAAVACGCLWMPSMAWLPDSSGFVYSRTNPKDPKKIELVFHDLGSGAQRTLAVPATSAEVPVCAPAVSPDGKRIALVIRDECADEGPVPLRLFILDRDGAVLHRDLIELEREADRQVLGLFWAPAGDKLLVVCSETGALYDLSTKRQITWAKRIVPITDGGPVLVDGKGFLIVNREPQSLACMHWNGRIERIPLSPSVDQRDLNACREMLHDGLFTVRRKDHVAVIAGSYRSPSRSEDVGVRIDLRELTALCTDHKWEATDDGGVVFSSYRLAGGRAVVRIVMFQAEPRRRETRSNETRFRVEVLKPGIKTADVIVNEAALACLVPAPDGKSVAVRHYPSRNDVSRGTIVVIDQNGKVVRKIDVGK